MSPILVLRSGVMNNLIPMSKAARLADLPLSRSSLARLARAGQIPATRIGGRWFARPDQLIAALIRSPAVSP